MYIYKGWIVNKNFNYIYCVFIFRNFWNGRIKILSNKVIEVSVLVYFLWNESFYWFWFFCFSERFIYWKYFEWGDWGIKNIFIEFIDRYKYNYLLYRYVDI